MSSSEVERATSATDPTVLAELAAAALRPIDEAYSAWGGEPDEWLEEPAFAEHRKVLEAVAANPYLPQETALALAIYMPDRIARHPVFRTFDVEKRSAASMR